MAATPGDRKTAASTACFLLNQTRQTFAAVLVNNAGVLEQGPFAFLSAGRHSRATPKWLLRRITGARVRRGARAP